GSAGRPRPGRRTRPRCGPSADRFRRRAAGCPAPRPSPYVACPPTDRGRPVYGERVRLGVIDVGSNTIHLLVGDAHHGAAPIPATSHKMLLRLSEHVDDEGHIDDAGAASLSRFVTECLEVAEERGCEEILA